MRNEAGPPHHPVYLPYVTDVDNVHYFQMTRLGAFLAIPLVYPSYFNQTSLAEARAFEVEKREAEKKRLEEMEEARKNAEEESKRQSAKEPEELEELPPSEPVPEKQMVLTGEAVKMVLCLDTLGLNTQFVESSISQLLTLCDACGECKTRTEKQLISEQVLAVVLTLACGLVLPASCRCQHIFALDCLDCVHARGRTPAFLNSMCSRVRWSGFAVHLGAVRDGRRTGPGDWRRNCGAAQGDRGVSPLVGGCVFQNKTTTVQHPEPLQYPTTDIDSRHGGGGCIQKARMRCVLDSASHNTKGNISRISCHVREAAVAAAETRP